MSNADLVAFLLALELYAIGSWLVLLRFWDRMHDRVDVQFILVAIDIAICAVATYVTGAERSWLFFLIALRLADTGIGPLRTLVLAHLALLTYLGMLAYVRHEECRDISAGLALVNSYTLYGSSLYFALIGRTAMVLRSRLASAARARLELIRELEERTARLEVSMKKANDAALAQKRFLSTVSHELRTPLTTIIAQTELVMDEASPEQGQIRDDLREVLAAARDLSGVIDNLIAVSSMTADEALTVETFDLAEFVREIAREVQPVMESSGNAFAVSNHALIAEIRCDRARLRQVLLILLGNAAKFTSRGSIALDVRDSEGPRPAITFTVSDTGIGVGDELRDTLFTAFTQGDDSTTRKFGGTGLGLAVAKRYADLMSADLSHRAPNGPGTIFTLVVPARPNETVDSGPPSPPPTTGMPS